MLENVKWEDVPSVVVKENEEHEKDNSSFSLFSLIKILLIILSILLTFVFCICLDVCRKSWRNGSRFNKPCEKTPICKVRQSRSSSKSPRPHRQNSILRTKKSSSRDIVRIEQEKKWPRGDSITNINCSSSDPNDKKITSILKKQKYVHFHKDTKSMDATANCSSICKKSPVKRSHSFPGETTGLFGIIQGGPLCQTGMHTNDPLRTYVAHTSVTAQSIVPLSQRPSFPRMGTFKSKRYVPVIDPEAASKPLQTPAEMTPEEFSSNSTSTGSGTIRLSISTSSSTSLLTSSTSSASSYLIEEQ